MTPRFAPRTNSTSVRTSLGLRDLALHAPERLGERLRRRLQQPAGLLERGDLLGAEAAPAQTHHVQPEEAPAIPHRERVRQHVAGGDRRPADERVRAHAAELVDARQAADRRVVLHLDVARERRPVGEDRVAAHPAVVRDVDLRHEQVRGADPRRAAAGRRPAVHGRAFAEHVAVADLDGGGFVLVLQVLGSEADRAEREEAVALPDPRVAVDHDVRVEHAAAAEPDARPDHAERAHAHARLEHGARRDARERVHLGSRQRRHLEQQQRLGRARLAHLHVAPEAREPAAPALEPHLEPELVARHDRPPELRLVEADDADLERARVGSGLEQPDARGLRQRLEDQHTRHHRLVGEVAGEEVLAARHVLGRHQAAARVVLEDAVHEDERVVRRDLADQPPDVAGRHAGRGCAHGGPGREGRPRRPLLPFCPATAWGRAAWRTPRRQAWPSRRPWRSRRA